MRDKSSNSGTPASIPAGSQPQIKFYRNKRIAGATLISVILQCLAGGKIEYFLYSFIIANLILDWWYFRFKKYKESTQNSPKLLQTRCGVTPDQLDQYTTFTLKVRRVAFIISALLGIISFRTIEDQFLGKIIFPMSYIIIFSSVVFIKILLKEIKYPYPLSYPQKLITDFLKKITSNRQE